MRVSLFALLSVALISASAPAFARGNGPGGAGPGGGAGGAGGAGTGSNPVAATVLPPNGPRDPHYHPYRHFTAGPCFKQDTLFDRYGAPVDVRHGAECF